MIATLKSSLETEVLRARPLKGLLLVLGNGVFVAAGIWLLQRKPSAGAWAAIAFFGLGMLVGLLLALRGAKLEIDGEGLRQQDPLRKVSLRWRHISEFQVFRIRYGFLPAGSWVFCHALRDPQQPDLGTKRVQLSDTFGLKADVLADKLNDYRSRALASTQSPAVPN